MIKKIFVLFLACVFPLFFYGCKGYRETDSEYFVSAVCFEKDGDKFKTFIEVLIINEENKDTGNKLFSSSGETPYDAVWKTVSHMPKNAVFDHCSTAVVDENITGKDLKAIIKYLYDIKNLNLGIRLFVSDDIKEVFKCSPQTMSIGYDIMAIESNITKNSGINFKNKYYEICSREISSGGFCLPIVKKENGRPAISGEKIYSDYTPVAVLGEKDALLYNLIYSGSKGGEIDIADKRCRVNRIDTNISAKGETLIIKIKSVYRQKDENKDRQLKKDTEKLIGSLYSNAALKTLGVDSFEQIKNTQVIINEK